MNAIGRGAYIVTLVTTALFGLWIVLGPGSPANNAELGLTLGSGFRALLAWNVLDALPFRPVPKRNRCHSFFWL